MKAVLVIDKPKNCEDCPLFRTERDFNATIHYCMFGKGKELFMVSEKGISEKCPLKPIPEKINVYFEEDKVERIFKKYYWEGKFGILNFKKSIKYAFISGYKRCIEELILGEEE